MVGRQDDHSSIVDAKSSEPIEQLLNDGKRASPLGRVRRPRRALWTDKGAIFVHDIRWMGKRHMDEGVYRFIPDNRHAVGKLIEKRGVVARPGVTGPAPLRIPALK